MAPRPKSHQSVKRHKLWAGCNGRRDPAAHKTKAELETELSLVQDYDFLRGLERNLESSVVGLPATAAAGSGGGSAGPHAAGSGGDGRRFANRQTTASKLSKAFERAGVRVEWMPAGFSRAKQNQTHLSKQNQIIWSVEYVLEDGSKHIGSCPENTRLLPACAATLRKSGAAPLSRKRSRDESNDVESQAFRPQLVLAGDSAEDPRATESKSTAVTESAQPIISVKLCSNDSGNGAESNSDKPAKNEDADSEPETLPSLDPDEIREETVKADILPPSKLLGPEYQLYLHVPRPPQPSTQLQLVPIDPDASLASILRGQLVLEVPTIYVWPASQRELPSKFTVMKSHGQHLADLRQKLLVGKVNTKTEQPGEEVPPRATAYA
ncbi:hypothetical protein MMC25_005589 [Agyrium rufum]|nr:hypothetical protein [Agyrium rufum]